MSLPTSFDDNLKRRLPLPLAQLYLRAHNAKTPLDRHLTSYYLWEAACKLFSSIVVVGYVELGKADDEATKKLQNLARPSVGHWWEFIRTIGPRLVDQNVTGFKAIIDLLLGRTRDDLPRCAGLDAALREAIEGTRGARSTVRLTELFDRLVQYRNRELGHGAAGQRGIDFYDKMARAIQMGVTELLGRIDVLVGRRLVYVSDVARLPGGGWRVELLDLGGERAQRIAPLDLPEETSARLPHPQRVYLINSDGTELWSLHPLLIFEPETEEVLFLNARRGKERTEYLCYTTGRTLSREKLGSEHRELLARVLGSSVDSQVEGEIAARNAADEGGTGDGDLRVTRSVGEFELLSVLGKGGMGVVYRAFQPSLGRQVALKCLLRVDDPKSEARFTREIHALGRVDHPNLVKILTSGAEGDHWFYAMELVEGAPLSALCERLGATNASAAGVELATWQATLTTAWSENKRAEKLVSGSEERDLPREAPATPAPGALGTVNPPGAIGKAAVTGKTYVRQAVEIIRQVADAVDRLHEARVVHRDIKPGNIMVTADGSRAVLMDLGLAQVIDDDSDGRLTRTRQFVGTLRYASPEQILAADKLDRRSDIYSLGVTLWEVLTLHAIYDASDAVPMPELMHRIQFVEAEPLKKYHPGIAEDLEAIVCKCLEKDRNRRYGTARELSDDLQRWLKGEPVRAQAPTFKYVLSKYARKHRAVIALSVALSALVIGTGVGTVITVLRANRMANAEAHRADIERDRANLELARATELVKKLTIAEQSAIAAKVDAEFSRAKTQAAIEEMDRERKRAEEQLKQRLAASSEAEKARLLAEDNLRKARDAIGALVGDANLMEMNAAQRTSEADRLHKAIDYYRTLLEQNDDDELRMRLSDSYARLGYVLRASDYRTDAMDAHEAALDLRRALVQAKPDDPERLVRLSNTYNDLGIVLKDAERYTDAVEAYEKSKATRQRLAELYPDLPEYRSYLAGTWNNLGIVYGELKRSADAIAAYHEAIRIQEVLISEDAEETSYLQSVANTYNNLGVQEYEDGKLDEAEVTYRKALQTRQTLADENPKDANRKSDVATSLYNLGILLDGRAEATQSDADANIKRTEAADAYTKALALQTELVESDSETASYLKDCARTYLSLGSVQRDMENFPAAADSFQHAVDLTEWLVARQPTIREYQSDLGLAAVNLGSVYTSLSQPEAALNAHRKAYDTWKKLVQDNPDMPTFTLRLAISCYHVGYALLTSGQTDAVVAIFNEQISLREKYLEAVASDPEQAASARRSLASAHGHLGESLIYRKSFADALEHIDKGLEIDPTASWMIAYRAHALLFLGRYEAARDAYLEVRSLFANAHGRFEETIAELGLFESRGVSSPDTEKLKAFVATLNPPAQVGPATQSTDMPLPASSAPAATDGSGIAPSTLQAAPR